MYRSMNEATVKQCKDTLEQMREIYPFEDEKTYIDLDTAPHYCNAVLKIVTKDENRDVVVRMEKELISP